MPDFDLHPTAGIFDERAAPVKDATGPVARVVLHYGYMESPRVPAALASLRKADLKIDIMTMSVLSWPLDDRAGAQFEHAFVARPALL